MKGSDESKTTLTRNAGSKGSLHSLLVNESSSESSPSPTTRHQYLRQSHEEGMWHERSALSSRLSQSYSQPRSAFATRAELEEKNSELRGELEWLDRRYDVWRTCWCVLKDGFVRCSTPWASEDESETGDDETFALEELALAEGERGFTVATLSMTRVTLVATDPLRGREAFRVVVEPQTEYSFRAKSRDAMVEWLFGFHRSLSIVISRLRSLKHHQQHHRPSLGRMTPGGTAPLVVAPVSSSTTSSSDQAAAAGSPEMADLLLSSSLPHQQALHKKTSSRRRFGSPSSGSSSDVGFLSASPPGPAPLLDTVVPLMKPGGVSPCTTTSDEGVALYRKSSARPHSHSPRIGAGAPPLPRIQDDEEVKPVGKYVPPHLRKLKPPPLNLGDSALPPPPRGDTFEETGDDETVTVAAPPPSSSMETIVEDGDAWRSHNNQRNFRWRSGACCERGQRQRNEDACVEVPGLSMGSSTFAFYAVYDGHSGVDAVQRCQTELHCRVRDKLLEMTPDEALGEAFAEVDAAYCADAAENRASLDAGATALACLLEVSDDDAKLVVANCGDCSAVLARHHDCVPLSRPHAPTPGSDEAQRVLAAGGWITSETDLCVGRLHSMDLDDPEILEHAHERVRLNEIHRVCGEVAVTRAIGDVDFKGWGSDRRDRPSPCFVYPEDHPRAFQADLLIPTPDIVQRTLDPDDAFVVLATDGLWDVVDPQEAIDVARSLFERRRSHPRDVAQHLVQRALRLGSGDNITVAVIQFDFKNSGGHEKHPSFIHALPPRTRGAFHSRHDDDDDIDDDDDDVPSRRVPPILVTASPPLLPTQRTPSLNDDLSEIPFELSVQ